MCEFCVKHGEGEKWYLQAKNYSEDLLSDIRRRRYIEEFVSGLDGMIQANRRLEMFGKTPRLIRHIVGRIVTRSMKRNHFGQVVPIEEIEKIFGFVNSIIRIACVCRQVTLGKEKRYCYAVSMGPDGGEVVKIMRGVDKSYINGPDAAENERLTKDEAMTAFHEHEREGLCHTVWTMQTPFIAAICNCDRSDCLAMRSTVTHALSVMFRAEYVAEIFSQACVGCRSCVSVCQFGAIAYSASTKKAIIDQRWCYGCGLCRSICKTKAIRLEARANVPIAAKLW
ncbi:MAG TPA: 4Fe-4S binding protein [Syntrophorhabdaceae bacterium]|nr:4Fe-4S binding protein [Syntrophorhabdaceae bacterium]